MKTMAVHSIALAALLVLASSAAPAQEMFRGDAAHRGTTARSEEHTSELQSLV